ncbi:MAG: hypothetical protein WA673_13810, partial [Candidatus Acidiferrales bacterium]
VALEQRAGEKLLLHRKMGVQESDGPAARLTCRPADGIRNMQDRRVDSSGHVIEYLVRRIGGEQQPLAANPS